MENGYYIETIRIKDSATPIDNITKFAYYDDDYETVKEWHEYDEYELEMMKQGQIREEKEKFLDTAPNIQADQDKAICELYELIIGGEA